MIFETGRAKQVNTNILSPFTPTGRGLFHSLVLRLASNVLRSKFEVKFTLSIGLSALEKTFWPQQFKLRNREKGSLPTVSLHDMFKKVNWKKYKFIFTVHFPVVLCKDRLRFYSLQKS